MPQASTTLAHRAVSPGHCGAVGAQGHSLGSLFERVAQVRQAFCRRECDPQLLARLYLLYNPVPDVERFVARALRTFPKYCCGLASVYLRHALGEGVVTCGLYGGDPHSFLLRHDGIIDITADQFGGPEVYVGPLRLPWRTRVKPPSPAEQPPGRAWAG